jgi:hypothetical protein
MIRLGGTAKTLSFRLGVYKMTSIEEQERAAYISGDTATAALLDRIRELELVIQDALRLLAITDTPGVNDDIIDLLEGRL